MTSSACPTMTMTSPTPDLVFADPRIGGECPHDWFSVRGRVGSTHRVPRKHPESCTCLGSGLVGVRRKCESCLGYGFKFILINGGVPDHEHPPCSDCSGLGYIDRKPELEVRYVRYASSDEVWQWRTRGGVGWCDQHPTREAAILAGRCNWWGVTVAPYTSVLIDGESIPMTWRVCEMMHLPETATTPNEALTAAIDAGAGVKEIA